MIGYLFFTGLFQSGKYKIVTPLVVNKMLRRQATSITHQEITDENLSGLSP